MLTSVGRIRRVLGWTPERDQDILGLIQTAEGMLADLTDRVWTRCVDHEATVMLDENSQYFRLKLYPLEEFRMAVWPLEEDKPNLNTASELLTEDLDYTVNLETAEVELLRRGDRRVRVRMTGGYGSTEHPVPQDILSVLDLQIKFMTVRESPANASAKSSSADRSANVALSDSLYHPRFEEVAGRYRRHVV